MSQHAHVFETTIAKPLHLDYLLSLPANYGAELANRWPLILFLHGAGGRVDDGSTAGSSAIDDLRPGNNGLPQPPARVFSIK